MAITIVYDMMEDGYVSLDADMTETIEDLHVQLTDAQLQLKGENYSRLAVGDHDGVVDICAHLDGADHQIAEEEQGFIL